MIFMTVNPAGLNLELHNNLKERSTLTRKNMNLLYSIRITLLDNRDSLKKKLPGSVTSIGLKATFYRFRNAMF